ncbi:uncharacterized protein LOC142334018 [Lycorma delicatula]|uniref:uncharacterized protein LOC142334018 n=1 Tax=Lycorma delicatula TaxID=130591 RepID=UPI003F51727F
MNVPANNSFINESLSLSKNIKLENEQENVGEMICIFLPNHLTETDTSHTSSEHQVDLVRLNEEPLDIINSDIPEDPLAIEETTLVKSENLKVESEVQIDLVGLKEEPLDIVVNGDILKDPLAIEETTLINSENLKVENEVESEISLNDEVTSQLNFNMKTNDLEINKYLHMVKTEKEIGFYPSHDIGIIKGSTKKNYICNVCQKSFNRKYDLKRHFNRHIKEKNYICNFCQKSFYQSSDLKIHLNIHTKEKNYICNFCQKIFNCYSNLKVHVNLHTKEKKYICNLCQKSFNRKYDLKRHYKNHTKEKNYVSACVGTIDQHLSVCLTGCYGKIYILILVLSILWVLICLSDRIMNEPVNNSFINESLSLNKNIKLEDEQENVGEMISIFLPNHMTETDTSSEHQVDLVRLNEEPLDIINSDIPEDPLAIEETTLVKSENLKVESEVQIDLVGLKEEPLDIVVNGDILKDPLAIKETTLINSENLKVENEVVTIDKGIIKGNTKKNYICNVCQKSFNRKCNLKRHFNRHIKGKNYICNFCQKSFYRSSDLKVHLNIHTKEKNYICNFCQKIFNRYSNLKVHINLHTKEKNYICNLCQKSFNRKYDLKRHYKNHTKEKNYISYVLMYKTACVGIIDQHLSVRLTGCYGKIYILISVLFIRCVLICLSDKIMNEPVNNSFINESLFLNKNIKLEDEQENVGEMISIFLPNHVTETDTSHTSSEHQVDLVQLKEEPLDIINGDIPEDPLAIEETTLVKSENLKVESEVKSEISLSDEVSSQLSFNIKTDELQINDKYLHTVKTEEEIGFYPGHVTIDKGIKGSTKKNYICNFCQKLFNRKNSLKTHLNIHRNERSYVCNFCQKSFNQRSTLKLHLNIHTKEKNYICNVCQKSFNRKYDLKRHFNCHIKEENYICNFCQKSFYQSYALKLHLNIHTKENSYICSFCQKSFNRKYDLKRHINSHTKEKNYIYLYLSKYHANFEHNYSSHYGIKNLDSNNSRLIFLGLIFPGIMFPL